MGTPFAADGTPLYEAVTERVTRGTAIRHPPKHLFSARTRFDQGPSRVILRRAVEL